MNAAVVAARVEQFRALVAHHLGLQFEEAKMGWLADVLRRRMECTGVAADPYLARLAAGPSRNELGALAQELTVGETYFFRNIDQFHALRECVLPDRLRAPTARRGLRVLSAGCASGEEAYSIAMTLRELLPDPSCELWIRAVDLNPAMIEKALRARYTAWALRETPPAMQQRWFRPDGRELVLDDAIRFAVTFEERNLSEDDPELWLPGAYDVVFCRNVLMYFAAQSAQALVARITRSLAPGGYLFLGHAETLRGLSQAFHLRHTHATFYYQQKDGVAPAAQATPAQADVPDVTGPALAAVVEGTDNWVEAIGKAAERVRTLTQATTGTGGVAAGVPEPWHLGPALELFRQERFADALGLVQALPPESAHDPDVLLLHAVLLAHGGQLAKAEDACHRLLALDELNAGAHYVLALCREGAGDRRGAADRDQAAVYLDPSFAMPRMHLGLLARRAGERETLRHEMAHALALLEREDPSRLLLFGGGFNRETLLALCRAELQASGESR
ncbi:CheR family methyltransferase [Piscinibacter sp.]|jgi:chemotaxis protein methyltransferase CheR|uniref:CheR family methyltransferase n=1 Tax=Piscinibacter sp. TaxID=1903157 RepID=UPI002F4142A9